MAFIVLYAGTKIKTLEKTTVRNWNDICLGIVNTRSHDASRN